MFKSRIIEFVLNPKRVVFFLFSSIIFTAFILVNASRMQVHAAPGINQTINFQGKVVNSNGTNVTDGEYTFVFRIYNVSTGGTHLWTETQSNVQVTAGVFRVALGSTTAITGVDFNTDSLYLGINFNSDGEMTPRVRFATVPYAFNAEKVAGLTVTNTTGTFTLTDGKTLTVSNTLGLSGTDGTTFTFPTGSGTVVTLDATQALSNKSFTSTVTFDGITTDITTDTNESLTIAANGTGNVLIQSGSGGQAALVVDKTGLGDIFSASVSGVTKFTIENDGIASSSAGFVINAAGNIQTTNNQTLTLGGDTTGNIVLWSRSGSGYIGINNVNPASALDLSGSFRVRNTADATDYFEVASGNTLTTLTRTTNGSTLGSVSIDSSGTLSAEGLTAASSLTISNFIQNGGILFANSSGSVSQTLAGSTGQCFKGGTSPTWGECGGSNWVLNSSTGVLSPINNTLDLLMGGTSTQSAKFSVLGIAGADTPVASVSATSGSYQDKGIYLSGDGSLQSVRRNTLTVGGSTTGDIAFKPGNASTPTLYLATNGAVGFNGSFGSAMNCLVSNGTGSAPSWGSCLTGTGTNFFTLNASQGIMYPVNETLDILVGSTASSTAEFAVRGIAVGTNPTASISATSGSNSGNGITIAGDGSIQTMRNNTLTIGGNTTGNINLMPGNGSGRVAVNNNAVVTTTSLTSSDGSGVTSSGSGFEASGDNIGLLQGCSDDQVLKWNESSAVWECGSDRATVNIVKAVDETLASSTTLQDDNELLFAVAASETWSVQVGYIYTTGGSSSPDIRVALNAPAGATCTYGTANISHAGNLAAGEAGTCNTAITIATTATGEKSGLLGGSVVNGANTGNIAFRWAQGTSNATSTQVENGSYLIGFKVSGADLAEVYYATQSGILPGDVVALDPARRAGVILSGGMNDPNVLGIVATKPGIVMGEADVGSGVPVMVALSGRVPVKVTDENGKVMPGDYLVASSRPGYAMRATRAGPIIGQALTAQVLDGAGEVIAFVKNGYFNGDISKELLPFESGDEFEFYQNRTPAILSYLMRQRGNGPPGGFQVNLSEIYTDRLIAGLEIVTPRIFAGEADIGTIRVNQASVSGVLVVDTIKARRIEGLEFESDVGYVTADLGVSELDIGKIVQNQEELQLQMASLSAKLERMDSVNLLSTVDGGENDFVTVRNLVSFGTTTLSEVSVMEHLTIGNGSTLTIGRNSINTIGDDLSLQDLRQGAINFLGGLIAFSSDGRAVFSEDTEFEKNVTVRGVLSASTVNAASLTIPQGEVRVLSDTEVEATAAAGLVVINKDKDYVKIYNPLIRQTSFIFVTPKTKTSRTLFLLEQVEARNEEKGYFVVGSDRETDEDIKFNYLIVN